MPVLRRCLRFAGQYDNLARKAGATDYALFFDPEGSEHGGESFAACVGGTAFASEERFGEALEAAERFDGVLLEAAPLSVSDFPPVISGQVVRDPQEAAGAQDSFGFGEGLAWVYVQEGVEKKNKIEGVVVEGELGGGGSKAFGAAIGLGDLFCVVGGDVEADDLVGVLLEKEMDIGSRAAADVENVTLGGIELELGDLP